MGGYYQFERDVIHSKRYSVLSSSQKLILQDILIDMNYKDESITLLDGEVVTVKAGQLFTTIEELSTVSSSSKTTVRRSLEFFSASGFVRVEIVGKYLILTPNIDYILGKDSDNASELNRAKDSVKMEQISEQKTEQKETNFFTNPRSKNAPQSEPKSDQICSKNAPNMLQICSKNGQHLDTLMDTDMEKLPYYKEYKNSRREEGKKAAPAPASKRAHPSVAKKSYAEHGTVKLTEEEYATFCARYPDAAQKIQHLEDYMTEKERTYANHFAVLCKWAEEDTRKERARPQSQDATNRRHGSRRRPRRDKSAYASSDTRLSDIEEAEWIRKKLLHDRMLMMDEIRDNDSFGEKDVLLEPTFAACAVG